ncbi:ribitol-5-phosphate xylosyltransferase 1 [Salmo salar]|uniref:Transmembrane protein 5 n=1 Tax=Salmo salar TaxID=8030 RepID=C0HBP0_SALSA|nr:ribitol-5-phosphate xylosyltransferase 1 [Salmo salar]ACN11459.1 Transmembrane protein 5 [Salmo salar]|eukprot:NP_001167357.1 UDP-D-xylose:ribitol-5-phosphate beta1,4-xylosyltransferase [Salmo salar]
MKKHHRKIFILIVFVYVVFSLYAAYNVFFNTKVITRVHRVVKKITVATSGGGVVAPNIGDDVWNPWEDEQANALSALHKQREAFRQYQERIDKNRPKRYKVQIWGKAAIGLYLWEHILEGPLNPTDIQAQWREGEIQVGKIDFSFYTGPAVIQGHVPLDTDSVVLVLNGREQQKISYATRWLQHVQTLMQFHAVNRVAVVLLGSERCTNDWISPYLRRHGGFVDLLFLVYDSPWVNDKDVFQWPLGVATYRQFPVVMPNSHMVSSARPFLCNFLGTVYKNSSRETLMGILKQTGLDKECITTGREKYFTMLCCHCQALYQFTIMVFSPIFASCLSQ